MNRTTNERWTRTVSQFAAALIACLALVALATFNPAAANDPVDDLGDEVEEEIEDNVGRAPPGDPSKCYKIEEEEHKCCDYVIFGATRQIPCPNEDEPCPWEIVSNPYTDMAVEDEDATVENPSWYHSSLGNYSWQTSPECRFKPPECTPTGHCTVGMERPAKCSQYFTNGQPDCPRV